MRLLDFIRKRPWAITEDALNAHIDLLEAKLGGRLDASAKELRGLFGSDDEGEERPYCVEGGVAVIPIEGTISKKAYWFSCGASTMQVQAAIKAALDDPDARAILLDIDSPGGTVDGVRDLVGSILKAREAKPVYAYTDGQMCSAAMWIGSAAQEIGAQDTADVGSIGVFMCHVDCSRRDQAMGLQRTYVHAGKYKVMGNPAEPLSSEARQYLQANIDEVYDIFLEDVAAHRGLSREQSATWADGQVFSARKALQIGLIDRLESRSDFVAHIQQEVRDRMDAKQLQQQYPDLVQQIESEAARKAAGDQAGAVKQAAEEARGSVLDVAEAVVGKEAAGKLRAVVEAGMNRQQVEAVMATLGQGGQDKADEDESSRRQILDGLIEASSEPAKAGRGKSTETVGDAAGRLASYVNR